jgi:hypothetical protein
MGAEEIQPVYRVVATWLAEQAGPQAPEQDWSALAAVLVNATTHYWLLGDSFGEDPAGITRTATWPPWPNWRSASSTTLPQNEHHKHARPHDHR